MTVTSRSQRQYEQDLNALVDEILWGTVDWPPDPDYVQRRLSQMGLGDEGTCPPNGSVKIAGMDLYFVFLGIFEPDEIPLILEDYDLFSPQDSEQVWWDRLKARNEACNGLRARIQLAYRMHFGQSISN